MNKDQWTESQPGSDTSKGDRPITQTPMANPEDAKAFGKRSAAALKDEVKEVTRSASETAKDVGKEAKIGAYDVARTAADVASTAKVGAQDTARAGSESAKDAAKELRTGAQDIGKTAENVASTVKEGAEKAATELKQGAKGLVQHTKDAAADIGEAAKDVVAAAKDTAIDVGAAAKDALAVAQDDASELVQTAATGVKAMAREVGPAIRRGGRATGTFVAANAVPLSLLGFGAGWMLMKGRRRSASSQEQTPATSVHSALSAPSEPIAGAQPSESIAGEIHHARGKAGEFVHAASERAREVAHDTRERAIHLKDQTVHQMEGARDAMSRQATKLSKEARGQLVHAKEVTSEFAHHNPLMLIAFSLGAGMGTSYLFPSTRSEKRLMGGPRDRLVGEARETVSRIGEIAHKAAIDARQPLQH